MTARSYDSDWVTRIIKAGGGTRFARHWYVYPGSIPLDRVTRLEGATHAP